MNSCAVRREIASSPYRCIHFILIFCRTSVKVNRLQ